MEHLKTAKRSEMTVASAKKAMESINYLRSPAATKDAIERLKYWRESPALSDGMRSGNQFAMSGDTLHQLKGFYIIHQTLGKADVELQLLKRLNYISLWNTIILMSGGQDDKKALREAKVK